MEPSRPAAMPLKNATGAAVAGGGEPPYDGGMEHRMTAPETRLDTILPTLATKADVEALRSDFNAQFGAQFSSLRSEFDKTVSNTDTKFAELRADLPKMNAEIKIWTLATMITIVGAMLAAIFGISQIYKNAATTTPAAQQTPIIITIPGASSSGGHAGAVAKAEPTQK